jgi:ABC-2 type transport system permease protein
MNVGVNVIAGSVRGEQIGGTFELMLLSPTHLVVMLSSFPLWDYAFATLTVLAYLSVGGALGMGFQHANLPVAMLSLVLSVASFTALGLSAASFTILLKSGNPLGWMIRVSSLLLSGVYYPVDVLPAGLRALAQVLPLTHALTLMRRSLLRGEGLATLWGELLVLLGLTLVLIVLGILACQVALFVARTDGSLSHQ